MQNQLDSKLLLRVFDKITRFGDKQHDAHHLDGVKAFTDFDGYTVYIEDALVKLSFGFHNQYHFDYQKAADFEAFEKKIKHIDSKY